MSGLDDTQIGLTLDKAKYEEPRRHMETRDFAWDGKLEIPSLPVNLPIQRLLLETQSERPLTCNSAFVRLTLSMRVTANISKTVNLHNQHLTALLARLSDMFIYSPDG